MSEEVYESPIPGMKTKPYGLPLMIYAFLGCVSWAASEPKMMNQFIADTPNLPPLKMVRRRSGIEMVVDQACGHIPEKPDNTEAMACFADWVCVNVWGQEGDVTEIPN